MNRTEVIRAVVLRKLADIPFPKCLAMVAVDRVNDLVGLAAVVLLAVVSYKPQGAVVIPEATFGYEITFAAERIRQGESLAVAGLFIGVAGLIALFAWREKMLRTSDAIVGLVSRKLALRVHGFLDHFAQGLDVFRSARGLILAATWSLVTWGVFILFLFAAFKAFDIHAPWYTALVMQVMVAVALSVPGAPGFVGQYHAPVVTSLMMLAPGMDDSRAKAFAIVIHLLNLITVVVVGVICLALYIAT